MFKFLKRLEIEWKIFLLASVVLFAFAYPVQNFFLSRLKSTINQSIDPSLEKLLVSFIRDPEINGRDEIVESLQRHRQWQALIPIILDEQEQAMLLLSVVLFISLLILAFLSVKKLTKPLKDLSIAAQGIAKGGKVTIQCKSGGALGKLENTMDSMQDELLKLRERTRAQGMETAWRDIARVMAHEIKNPLTPIQLTLDRIQERVDKKMILNSDELEKFVDRIGSQVESLERLVNDFRSFSREPEPQLRNVSLRTCLEPLIDDLSGSVQTIIIGDDAYVRIDPHLFGRALLNLWKNSLEAGATAITISIKNENTVVIVVIDDNGSGISDDLQEQVWVPYTTFKKGGTGLGLPVVKRIVESMGGEIAMDSSTDEMTHGTRFTISLMRKDNGQSGSFINDSIDSVQEKTE